MPDVVKILIGGAAIVVGTILQQPIVVQLGAGLALSGISGIIGSLGGGGALQDVHLAVRQQSTLLTNHPTPGAPVPVVYGRTKLGSITADFRIDTAAKEDILIPCVMAHGSRDGLGIAGIDEIFFDDRLAFDNSTPPVVQAPFTSGTAAATELRGLDAENWGTTTAGGKSLSGVTADWSATTDKGGGLAGMLLLLTFDTDIYPTGLPVFTAKISGNFVEDTRSEVSGVNITFANGGGSATITRASGSFVTDGWFAQDRVDVTGSASNDGKYTISSVAALALTLVVAEVLTAEGPVGGVTLKRWAHPTSGGGDNPAMCIRDYLLSTVYGAAMAEADIDTASFEAMANFYDETVTIPGGSQKRYRCNGWIDVSRSIGQVLGELLSSCRGNLVYEGGKFRLFTTRVVTPSTIALTQDNIVGDWQFTNAGAKQKFNVARATFIDPTRNHMPDLVQWPNPGATNTFLTDDNSFENRLGVELPFTFDRFQAEQTVMTMVKESRQGIAAAVTVTEEALQLQIGDVVPVTHDTPGWTAKNFWVMGVGILSDTRVRLALLEYDAVAYSLDTETADAGEPNTDLPNPFTVAAPTGLTLVASSTEAISSDAGVYIQRIKVTWTDAVDVFVDHYEIQAKITSEAAFDAWGNVVQGEQLFFIFPATNESWSVRIRTVNTLGIKSSFVSATITPAVSLPIIAYSTLTRDLDGNIRAIIGTSAALSVRVAASKSAFPSLATTQAATAVNTDAEGAVDINNLIQLDPGENAFVTALAFELVAGGGRESTPLIKVIEQRWAYNEQKSAQTQTLQDFQILLRDPDVAHGMTAILETDIHGAIGFVNGLIGGLSVLGFSEGAAIALLLQGSGVTGGNAAVKIEGFAKSGTGRTAVSGATPILSVSAGSSTTCFRAFADSLDVQKILDLANDLELSERTPSSLPAFSDDLATGTVTVQRMVSTTGNATIRGLAGGRSGRFIIIVEIGGTNGIILNHQDTNSSAANRIIGPLNQNFAINRSGSVSLWYDDTTSRWRIIAPLAST